MHSTIRKWTILAALTAGFTGVGITAPAVAADEKADQKAQQGKQASKTYVVTSVEDAPRYGRRQVKKALEKLDEDHKLQITTGQFFDSGHSSSTNEFEPFVASLVPLNKEGEKDGVEHFLPEPRTASGRRSVTWVDGEKHGPEKVYDRRGRVIEEIPWVEGQKHGVRKTFDAKGNVLSVAHYKNGAQTGVSKSFDSEGNLLRKVPYKDGQKHGKRVDYWSQTGEPKRIVPYRNGLAHGEVVEYHLNGEVKMRVNTVEGQLHGKQEIFSDEGKLIAKRYWWDGSYVSQSEFEAKQKGE
jgi:antitoxin component YwqK of YwqJK toxin-antitoxin module